MSLAFTDLNARGIHQASAGFSRPLATISPSAAGSQSAGSAQRSSTCNIFDLGSCGPLLLQHHLLSRVDWLGAFLTLKR
jgi:hypothetical protein